MPLSSSTMAATPQKKRGRSTVVYLIVSLFNATAGKRKNSTVKHARALADLSRRKDGKSVDVKKSGGKCPFSLVVELPISIIVGVFSLGTFLYNSAISNYSYFMKKYASDIGRLKFSEWMLACSGIVALYSSVLYALHLNVYGSGDWITGKIFPEGKENKFDGSTEFSDFKTIVWDHPEPNFTFSPAISEFYSTISAIPIAGAMQLYLATKFGYDVQVKVIYFLAFWMYNSAMWAHLTLNTHIFELTLSSVMFCAITTFFFYAYILGKMVPRENCSMCALVAKAWKRLAIAMVFMSGVIASAIKLPSLIGVSGGVWTLFYVQTPPVFLACGLSMYLYVYGELERLKQPCFYLSVAGSLLSVAMLVSYVECSTGSWQMGFLDRFEKILGPVPVLHIAIHVLEQIGIYLFLTALACLHGNIEPNKKGKKSTIKLTSGWFGIPYCELV